MQRKMNMKALALVLTAGAMTGAANAQIAFGPATTLSTPRNPDGVAAADFTGDGNLDLAVVLDGPDRLLVMAGDGAGGFVGGPVTFLGSGLGGDAATAHDIDGDGDQDVVIVFDNTSSVRIMLNDGAGNFTTGERATTGAEPVWIAKGRINANPAADFVVVNRDSNSVTVLLDFGVSTVSSTLAVGAEPRSAAIGDFNGDGNADLAVTNHDSRSIGIYTGNGAGGFVAGQVITTPGQRPEGIVSADFDRDGDADLAATVDDFVQVYRNDAGAFSFAGRVGVGSFDPSEMYVGNFAPGGVGPDVMTVNNDGNSISVFENLGGLAFSGALVLPTGTSPEFAAVADFDGSGSADIAVTNRDSQTTSVFINRAVVGDPCRADFDGDGRLTIFDFLAFQTAFGMGNPRADIDGDGSLTLFDFLAFQNLFVAGCP